MAESARVWLESHPSAVKNGTRRADDGSDSVPLPFFSYILPSVRCCDSTPSNLTTRQAGTSARANDWFSLGPTASSMPRRSLSCATTNQALLSISPQHVVSLVLMARGVREWITGGREDGKDGVVTVRTVQPCDHQEAASVQGEPRI
ncbi:hypothetical protein C8R45DRAFT_937540 [Mycena sanguinolenta]|nr:hypothetical protein C8R45DRAFT_937540 [Mycena sanguinolenta]